MESFPLGVTHQLFPRLLSFIGLSWREGEKEEEGKAAREKSGRDGGLKVRLALLPPREAAAAAAAITLSSVSHPSPRQNSTYSYGIWAGEEDGRGGGNLARALSTATYYYYYCIAQIGEEGGAGKETNLCKHRTLFTWPHIPPLSNPLLSSPPAP